MPDQPNTPKTETKRSGLLGKWDETSIIERVAIALIGAVIFFILTLVIAVVVGVGFGDTNNVAQTIAIVRDLFLILLAMQAMIITLALTVLILQIASLTNLLQNELNPTLKNLQQTSQTVKGTTEFLSDNVAAPVIEATAWVNGALTFLRKLRGQDTAPSKPASKNPNADNDQKSPHQPKKATKDTSKDDQSAD